MLYIGLGWKAQHLVPAHAHTLRGDTVHSCSLIRSLSCLAYTTVLHQTHSTTHHGTRSPPAGGCRNRLMTALYQTGTLLRADTDCHGDHFHHRPTSITFHKHMQPLTHPARRKTAAAHYHHWWKAADMRLPH